MQVQPGYSKQDVEELATHFPQKHIPDEMAELLRFCPALQFERIGEVRFDAVHEAVFEELFPCALPLAHDGAGNVWIVDIDSNGNWGKVLYLCHDPAVVAVQSQNLADFLLHIHEYEQEASSSSIEVVMEERVYDIWHQAKGFIDYHTATHDGDELLQSFASTFGENTLFADLRDSSPSQGFAWGKVAPTLHKAVKHDSALLWAFEPVVQPSLWSRLWRRA